MSIELIKKLRSLTGAGMLDCKNALTEAGSDVEKAKDILRSKSANKAVKKHGREMLNGIVGLRILDNNMGILLEMNSETDFVAKNEKFHELCTMILNLVASNPSISEEELLSLKSSSGFSISDEIKNNIATIGENITFKRFDVMKASDENQIVVGYMHGGYTHEFGKIAALIKLKFDKDVDVVKVKEVGKKIAMHVVASTPIALSESDFPQDILTRERAVFIEQVKLSGKPENVVDKIVEGKVSKFLSETVLLKQAFIMDPKINISEFLSNESKNLGGNIEILDYNIYMLCN